MVIGFYLWFRLGVANGRDFCLGQLMPFDWIATFAANSSGGFVLRKPSETKAGDYPDGQLSNRPENI